MESKSQLKVSGAPPYNGLYDFDLEEQPLSTNEWNVLYEVAHIKGALELKPALEAGSIPVMTAFAIIAIERAGTPVHRAAVMAANDLVAEMEGGEEAAPLPSPSPSDESSESRSDSTPSSGDASTLTSDESANGHTSTGQPESPITTDFDRLTSAS